MSIPDHPAKTWQIRIIYEDDTTVITTPNQLALFGLEIIFTKCAICHGKNVYENGI
jgi:mono/diheme cytochrome c family protein